MDQKVVVIPSAGIGDALLMMIASHRLQERGYAVTTLHSALPQLSSWFPNHTLALMSDLFNAELIVVQNDNSPKIAQLLKNHRAKLSIFYPTYCPRKHAPLGAKDQVFDSTKPMAENIAKAVSALLQSKEISKNNGLSPPKNLTHRLHKNRVIIHPTSSVTEKNWSASKYIDVAKKLKNLGFSPVFAVAAEERPGWRIVEAHGFELPLFDSLTALATYVYESGYVIGNDSLLGHLGSNLHLPTVIIADCEKRMKLWRPGWLQGAVVTPSSWIPNFKFFRLRTEKWQSFISPKRVLSAFRRERREGCSAQLRN